MKPEVISFDADGTLAKDEFIKDFYFKVIPRLYAENHDMNFEAAQEKVKEEYDSVGRKDIDWYRPNYWLEEFDIERDVKDLIDEVKHKREVYEETEEVLKELKEEYRLIVISNASLDFLEVQLEGIEDYFDEIFSCVSHIDRTKNDYMVYEVIFEKIDVVPKNVVHVGDNYEFDYKAAKKAGAEAFYLDREGTKSNEEYSISDLREIIKILNK